MKLGDNDSVAALLRVDKAETMLLITTGGFGKRVSFDGFEPHGRGTGGQRVAGVSERSGDIAGAATVRDDDEIMCVTSQGKSLRLKVNGLRVMGRQAVGVRLVRVEPPDFVAGVDRVLGEEE
jgi:DNA gyrase subunit A